MKNKIITSLCLAAIVAGFSSQKAAARTYENIFDAKSVFRFADSPETAEEILTKHVAALGGREAFARIKSIEMQNEALILGKISKNTSVQDVAGNRFVQRQDNGGMIVETGFDGARAWQKSPYLRGYLDASNPFAKAVTEGGISLPGAGLYKYEKMGKTFTRLADEQIEGVNYLVIKSEKEGEPLIKYYFDQATYLLKKNVAGNSVTQTTAYDDYRTVEGITVAFKTSNVSPQLSIERKYTAIKFNQPFDASIFKFEETTASAPSKVVTTQTQSPAAFSVTEKEIALDARIETFEMVWKTVNDTFFDRTFNGVDWQAMHEKYLPLAKSTAGKDDYYKMLNGMLQELHLSHFKVITPDRIITLDSNQSQATTGTTGLTFKWVENQLLVARVKKDSPAERAEIRPGFAVVSIDGQTSEAIYANYLKENVNFRYREELARIRSASSVLGGKPETNVKLELLGAKNEKLNYELTREPQKQTGTLEFESKKLAGNIGYIKFNSFFGDLLPKAEAALDEFKDSKALIIDLRGNPGGAGDLGSSLASYLNEESGSLGNLKFRYSEQPFSYDGAKAKAYRGRVIVLVDEGTASTSEIFAGGLQTNKRAVVIGSPSAGAVLASLVKLLPTRAALQYVVSGYNLPNGNSLEGRGVIPDIEVKPTRSDLLAGRDPVIEKAVLFAK
jgi:carboxyl-terminal processing protease